VGAGIEQRRASLRAKEDEMGMPQGFVCDGTCAGNELGDCNHGESNDGLNRRGQRPESAWNDGYDQAIEEVLDEVRQRSPTMFSAIVNKFPTWKTIMRQREDQLTLSGTKAG